MSWLLSYVYRNYLLEQGVSPDNIIILDFVKYGGKYDTNIIDSRIVKKHI